MDGARLAQTTQTLLDLRNIASAHQWWQAAAGVVVRVDG
jgi:hypothetical protein